MADLRLKSIEMRNWMTVKSSKITFPEKGLILVMGSNLAAQGKFQSIGAGKTALGEALARTLLGVSGRYTHLGYYLSDTEKSNMFVRLDADLLSTPFTVEMGFRCKELIGDGEALRFSYNGESFQAAKADQTRDRLIKTLQVTPALANWTAFIDGDKLKFSKMSQEDSVNLLMTALAQPPWTDYYEQAVKKLQGANRQVAVSASALEIAKSRVTRLTEDFEDAQTAYKEAQDEYQRQMDELSGRIDSLKKQISAERSAVKAAEQAMVKIKKQLKSLEDQKAVQNHKWEVEKQTLRDQLSELEPQWNAASELRTKCRTHVDTAEETLEEMRKIPKNCPTCGKGWDKAHSDAELKRAEAKLAKAQLELAKAEKAYDAQEKKRRETSSKIRGLDEQMRTQGSTAQVEELGEQYDHNEKLVRNLNAMIHQRELQLTKLEQGVDMTFVNKKLAVIEERERALKAGQSAVEAAAFDLTSDQEVQKVVQYWHKAFSPTGIPNMILTDAVPLLNRVAQRISNLMTGGTLQVTYSTLRELVSGESKAQLVTKVTNQIGSKRVEGSSKGEGGLANLIIAENLNEIGQVSNRVGFRWYDEVTSGQDAVVRRSIFAYLKEIADRMGILIFVVDHHAEASNYADYVLIAEKTKENGTTYYWR